MSCFDSIFILKGCNTVWYQLNAGAFYSWPSLGWSACESAELECCLAVVLDRAGSHWLKCTTLSMRPCVAHNEISRPCPSGSAV